MNHKIIDVLILVVAVVFTAVSIVTANDLHDFGNGLVCGVALIVATIIWLEDFT